MGGVRCNWAFTLVVSHNECSVKQFHTKEGERPTLVLLRIEYVAYSKVQGHSLPVTHEFYDEDE